MRGLVAAPVLVHVFAQLAVELREDIGNLLTVVLGGPLCIRHARNHDLLLLRSDACYLLQVAIVG
eukprot:3445371-Pyramimonas_sp.AAC.1